MSAKNQRFPWKSMEMRRTAAPRRSVRFRPLLEPLEDRLTPALPVANFFPAAGVADGAVGSLRAAIIAANGNGLNDRITLQAGTYALSVLNLNDATTGNNLQENAAATGDLDFTEVNQKVLIRGQGAGVTIIDATGLNDRVFHILANVHVDFDDLTIRGGLALEQGTPGAQNGAARGGGIFNQGTLGLNRVVIEDNEARGRPGTASRAEGGGIHSTGPLIINATTIRNNRAIGSEGLPGSFLASMGQFIDIPGGQGLAGGLLVTSNSQATVSNSTISGNFVNGGTGGVGGAGEQGFDGGKGGPGGDGGEGRGGGVGVRNGSTLTMINCTVSSNTGIGGIGGNGGPGIGGASVGVAGKGGNGEGGGISIDASTLHLFNTTVAANATGTSPGGVGASSSPGQTLGGGVKTIDDNTATLNSTSSLIAGNVAAIGPDVHALLDFAERTLVKNGSGASGIANNDAGANRVGVDPRLGPLAFNGGPTATHALLFGSAAIGGGSNPHNLTVDQRGKGFLRAVGGAVDIGAFEASGFLLQGSGPGAPAQVRVFDAALAGAVRTLKPFGGFGGGVRVATGDVNGDNLPDIIVAPASGRQPLKIIDGAKLHLIPANGPIPPDALLASFFPFAPGSKTGVFVAAGDVNGDGTADIIVGQGKGASRVEVIDGTKRGLVLSNSQISPAALLGAFKAYPSSFKGGVAVAAADVNQDGRADVIVGPASGKSLIRVIDGGKLGQVVSGGLISPAALLGNFLAYPGFAGGVFVAGGDVNGDGRADVIVGPATGNQPVRVINGAKLGQVGGPISNAAVLSSIFAFGRGFGGGVSVGAADFNGDGRDDVLAGSGPGIAGKLSVFDGVTKARLRSLAAFNNAKGVFVAG